jgi:molybdate transport system substrate-binding protein
MKKMRKIIFLLIFVITSTFSRGQSSNAILIAAASDLKFALDSVVTVFKKAHPGASLEVTYGSSGKLFEQISHTAPFDLFFSADIEYPLNLKKKGIAVSEVHTYGVGRVVIWSQVIDPNREQINSLLDKTINKIAIANPQHAPYGRRAEEALKHYKVYEKIKNRLVYGENISQTAQFVTAGAADAGIIALSLALSPTMKKLNGHYYIIPESAHKPLEQGFVILKKAEQNSLAVAFKDFMLGTEATKILGYFGFTKK